MRVFEAINSHTVERTKDKKVMSILHCRARNPVTGTGTGAGASEMIFNKKNDVLVLSVLKVILQTSLFKFKKRKKREKKVLRLIMKAIK